MMFFVSGVDREGLSDQIGSLWLRDDFSDINLVVDGYRMPGHKVILAARSEYFRALLYGGLRETHENEVRLLDVNSVAAFRHLLKYVYTGHLSLMDMKQDMVLEVLGLAHKYGFVDLEESISYYLRNTLSIKNVCLYYDASMLYGLSSLAKDCCSFIDRNALEVMNHESFHSLSASALREMISRDSFCAQEVDIFRSVVEWIRKNSDAEASDVLSYVRLPLISLIDLLHVVRPCELLSADVILDAIKARCESRDSDLRYRGFLMAEENVASRSHGASVLHGELPDNLLKGDVHNYDMEKGFTRHHIDEGQANGILIKLGMQVQLLSIYLLSCTFMYSCHLFDLVHHKPYADAIMGQRHEGLFLLRRSFYGSKGNEKCLTQKL